ncbi:helix-turn-helix domain-containing protein [Streptomyces sp. AP-93]|uniref:helix-turn-helix domain-containing protein n=1 Tax=Streptomyces sp. AP-93 TaxID=2929048 RepID=UPI001FAED970|nr:helix-turn-helix domain-containing protein [Streptomyces sp. AP-93]MCJ0873520.1 LuxR C-terminal-related transcriptional regulator [Streptomyces sp. AP-93]
MDSLGVDQEVLQRVYEYALDHSNGQNFSANGIGAATGLPDPLADAAMERLLAMGLLRGAPGSTFRAVAPDEAVAGVVFPLEREIRARRALAEEARASIMSLLPVFEAGRALRESQNRFEILEDLTQARSAIADLTAHARDEILTAQPGGARQVDILTEAAPRDQAALERGVKMRVLYQHTARFSAGTGEYVEHLTRLGAHVRTLDDHFSRLLVFDEETAVISVPGNPHAAAVVRERSVVAFVKETYERLWLAAEPFAVAFGTRSEIADDVRQAIVRLLMEGMTDASIATRLGMSVRTCRRHVADIMVELGAQSRFQAGYLLAVRAHRP